MFVKRKTKTFGYYPILIIIRISTYMNLNTVYTKCSYVTDWIIIDISIYVIILKYLLYFRQICSCLEIYTYIIYLNNFSSHFCKWGLGKKNVSIKFLKLNKFNSLSRSLCKCKCVNIFQFCLKRNVLDRPKNSPHVNLDNV